MSLKQLESEVAGLTAAELREFSAWFEQFIADSWDRQIEEDAANGNLDRLVKNLGINLQEDATQPLQTGLDRATPSRVSSSGSGSVRIMSMTV
jgi:hypothetical protein